MKRAYLIAIKIVQMFQNKNWEMQGKKHKSFGYFIPETPAAEVHAASRGN